MSMWQVRQQIAELRTQLVNWPDGEPVSKAHALRIVDLLGELAGETSSATDPRNFDPHWIPGH